MLEVHPPEHAPHSVRDFFLHIFTITVGLLIALGLEATVEWRHHVHLGHEAERNLRQELEGNRKDLALVVAAAPDEQKNLTGLLSFFKQRMDGKPTNLKSMSVGMRLTTLHDASWQTASATGALSYLPYEKVQRFAAAYQLQKQFEAVQSGALQPTINLEATLASDDPNGMNPADAALATTQTRIMVANIYTLQQLGKALDKAYEEAVKE